MAISLLNKVIVAHPLPKSVQDTIVPIEITSVSKWFYEENDQEFYDLEDDFPSVAPPFPVFWMEYHQPRTLRSLGQTKEVDRRLWGGQIGAMVTSFQIADDKAVQFFREDGALQALKQAKSFQWENRALAAERASIMERLATSNRLPRWFMSMMLFCAFPMAGPGVIYLAAYHLTLDGQGRIIHDATIRAMSPLLPPEVGENASSELFPFLFCLSLMHCKNVIIQNLQNPIKVIRAREKKGIPTFQFKTLIIDSLRETVKRESGQQHTGIKRALHICRGHFATYDDKPLFGKVFGTFWIPMHTRGDANIGIVHKDYEVRR